MDNKDLIKQYADIGQSIGRYQFNQLPDNIKITYLRKRMIAIAQYNNNINNDGDDENNTFEEEELLNSYEILGAPESYRSEIIKYLLNKMQPYFDKLDDNLKIEIIPDWGYYHGYVSPILKKIVKSDVWDSRIDNIIIDLSQNEKFLKHLNKATLKIIMSNVVNPSKVFSYLGNRGKQFKNDETKSLENAVDAVINSNSPQALFKFFNNESVNEYFYNLEPKQKAYKLSFSNNPKDMLYILGTKTMDYIKKTTENGDTNFISHLLNKAHNHYDMEKLFDQYGIDHSNVDKYYNTDT
jgi:hypothetical protein